MTELKKISFEDLINKSFLTKFEVVVEGVGTFELTELSNLEAAEVISEADKLEASVDADHVSHINKWASRLVKGSKATDEEILAISGNLGPTACTKIFYAGVNYRGNEAKAEAEKN